MLNGVGIKVKDSDVPRVLGSLVSSSVESSLFMTRSEIRVFDHGDHFRFMLQPTDGTSGVNWIARLANKYFYVGYCAKQVLRSPDFKPTSGVTTEVAVLKGMFFRESSRTTGNIRDEASKRYFTKPNAELACLLRENFTDDDIEAMGLLRIVVMHEPINDSCGRPSLLGASRDSAGRQFRTTQSSPDRKWGSDNGFAFVVSQVSSQ